MAKTKVDLANLNLDEQAVPANRMPYSGMPDARERADLIAFMLQVFK